MLRTFLQFTASLLVPRIVVAEVPEVAFQVSAGIAGAPVLLFFVGKNDLGPGRDRLVVMPPRVFHDYVTGLRFPPADFRRMGKVGPKCALSHGRNHDHPHPVRELRMIDQPIMPRKNRLLPKSKRLAKPFDRGHRIPVLQIRNHAPAHRSPLEGTWFQILETPFPEFGTRYPDRQELCYGMGMILYIGNKKTSSWSLRPWLVMSHCGIPFEERMVALYRPETKAEIRTLSPSGLVPALIAGELVIWDSLAICEFLAEEYPQKFLWPLERAARARARAVSAEMHSGFAKMRQHLSHNVLEVFPGFDWRVAEDDVKRICEIWTDCLRRSGGPFLFGKFSIADAMYAPVVNRFLGYDVRVEETGAGDPALIRGYLQTIHELPAHQAWIADARAREITSPSGT